MRTRGPALMREFGNEAGARQGAQAKKAKLVSVCACVRVCVCVPGSQFVCDLRLTHTLAPHGNSRRRPQSSKTT